MKFVNKVENASATINLGVSTEVTEKKHEVVIAAYHDVGDVIAHTARRKPLSLGHAHQETGQPPSKATAQDQNALVIELIEKTRRAVHFGLQRMEELDEVFLSYSVIARSAFL